MRDAGLQDTPFLRVLDRIRVICPAAGPTCRSISTAYPLDTLCCPLHRPILAGVSQGLIDSIVSQGLVDRVSAGDLAGVRLGALPSRSEPGTPARGSKASQARLSARAALEFRKARAAAASSDALSRTLRELATDLAISRRDYRHKQAQIESLEREITALESEIERLRARVTAPDEQLDTVHPAGGEGDRPGARRTQHEHTLARMSNVVLVLRRENLALTQENASLRVELKREREDRRPQLATAEDLR